MNSRSPISTVIAAALLTHVSAAFAQMEPSKVVVVKAKTVSAPVTTTLVGTVDPVRRSKVGSEIAGIVTEMPARQGDLIEAGGVLCRLRDDVLSLWLAEAKASLNAAKSRHEELLTGTRQDELVRLEALFDEASAEYDRWKFEMGRIEKLYDGRDSNAKEYHDTRAEYLAAERRRIAAKATFDLGVAGPREEVVAQAAYELAVQQARTDRIESDLRKAEIRAPFTGYVTARLTEVGEWIDAGGPVVEMIDLSTVLVRVDAPESALPYIKVGEKVRVQVDALKQSFDGRVKHVIRQADDSARTFPIEIEVDNSGQLLAGGMFARATVSAGPSSNVIAVPKDAIVERDGVANVAMVVPGEHGGMVGFLVGVTVGADVGDWIAVTSGTIQPGFQVVTRGNENIPPFPTPVVVVDEQGTPVAVPASAPPSSHGGPN
ncbi:MAG: efflux RND transporter periplasmic adaptor subunit [Phycisphaerales bacterium]|nr:MAG: efflux RND transporter periplasmic adaptor subunit [Phycisphaerales bacterium]